MFLGAVLGIAESAICILTRSCAVSVDVGDNGIAV